MLRKEFSKIGCFFIAIAAFLYAVKHLTAVIMTSSINSPEVNYFGGGYISIETGITFWTILSLLLGIIFLLFSFRPILKTLFHKIKK